MSRRALGALALGCLLPLRGAHAQSPPPIDPVATSLTVFAGAASGLWRSLDWGATFRPARQVGTGGPLADLGAVHAVVAVTPRVFVGAETGLLMSEDFGQTWKRLGLERPVLSFLPARYLQAEPTLLAGTRDGLMKSDDFGRTFKATPLKGVEVRRMEWPGPALVLGTGAGLYVSNDSGASFEALGAGLPSGDIRSMALSSFFSIDPVLFVGLGEAGGVHLSQDGGRSFRPAGLENRTVYDLYWLGPLLYAATDAGVFRSETLGADWVALNDGFKGEARRLLFPLAPEQGSIIFVISDQGLYRTSDGGVNWQFSTAFDEPIEVIATFPPPDPIVVAPKH